MLEAAEQAGRCKHKISPPNNIMRFQSTTRCITYRTDPGNPGVNLLGITVSICHLFPEEEVQFCIIWVSAIRNELRTHKYRL